MLTFILATLGKRNTLDRAVQSVRNQTKAADLIIVHDQHRAGAGPSRNSVVNEVLNSDVSCNRCPGTRQ
jgi:hypothetical protein